MAGARGWDKITNLSLLRMDPWQGLLSIFRIQIFIPLELLSRATCEGLALQRLQLLWALHSVLGLVATSVVVESRGAFNSQVPSACCFVTVTEALATGVRPREGCQLPAEQGDGDQAPRASATWAQALTPLTSLSDFVKCPYLMGLSSLI